jgi:hypothetical protein
VTVSFKFVLTSSDLDEKLNVAKALRQIRRQQVGHMFDVEEYYACL